MNLFRRAIALRRPDPTLSLNDQITVDDLLHGRDRQGFRPDQRQRWREFVWAENHGLGSARLERLAWLRWLYRNWIAEQGGRR